jgi:hypothetical protein
MKLIAGFELNYMSNLMTQYSLTYYELAQRAEINKHLNSYEYCVCGIECSSEKEKKQQSEESAGIQTDIYWRGCPGGSSGSWCARI